MARESRKTLKAMEAKLNYWADTNSSKLWAQKSDHSRTAATPRVDFALPICQILVTLQ
jgi:hypothetical protein